MKQSGFGIASLVLGIIGLLLSCLIFGIVPCIISIILAIVALTNKKSSHGTAIAGLVCSCIGIVIAIIVLALGDSITSTNNTKNDVSKVGEVEQPVINVEQNNDAKPSNDNAEEPVQEEFSVGDIVETQNFKITFLSSEEYTNYDEWSVPKDGYTYYRVEYEFENVGDIDYSVSSWNFECYADGYAVDEGYLGADDSLSATLSSGKKAKGAIYYEVPKDAQEIIVEYETNFWTSGKVIFKAK